MFAVIQFQGKQHIVKPNDKLTLDRLHEKEKETVYFDKILLYQSDKELKIGTPHVEGVTVEAIVTKNYLGDKMPIVKMKAKTRHKVSKGVRIPLTDLKIVNIIEGDVKKTEKNDATVETQNVVSQGKDAPKAKKTPAKKAVKQMQL